ncbi:MAG: amidohydrolase family protein, partial [Thermoguttaceae bacterium]
LDGATLRDHFGNDRLTWFQPYRTLYDKKVPIGGGSDHMLKIDPKRAINLYNPFLGMWTMLTRKPRWTETPIHLEQCVSREEAIKFYTVDSAYVMRSEKDRGSIEPEKYADFIILDRDILTCPIDEILETKVEQTWLGGTCNSFVS